VFWLTFKRPPSSRSIRTSLREATALWFSYLPSDWLVRLAISVDGNLASPYVAAPEGKFPHAVPEKMAGIFAPEEIDRALAIGGHSWGKGVVRKSRKDMFGQIELKAVRTSQP